MIEKNIADYYQDNLYDNALVLRLLLQCKRVFQEEQLKGLYQFLEKAYGNNGEVSWI